MSRHERSGWRDARISARHRMWGVNVPALDVDFLLVEYDLGEPRALVEYKHEGAAPVPAMSPNLRVISRLADRAGLPAFVVRYGDDFSWFRVRALNPRARRVVVGPGATTMTEDEYVAFLYRVRGRRAPCSGAQRSARGRSRSGSFPQITEQRVESRATDEGKGGWSA